LHQEAGEALATQAMMQDFKVRGSLATEEMVFYHPLLEPQHIMVVAAVVFMQIFLGLETMMELVMVALAAAEKECKKISMIL
jgi:hypothetical protein